MICMLLSGTSSSHGRFPLFELSYHTLQGTGSTAFPQECEDVKKESLRDACYTRVVGVSSIDTLSRMVHLG